MAREISRLGACTCSLVSSCSATLVKLGCIAILFFACVNAQDQYIAQLLGEDNVIQKDESHFWEQTRRHAEKQQTYYQYYQARSGPTIPRDDKSDYYSDYYYEYEDEYLYQEEPEVEEVTPAENDTSPSVTAQLEEVPASETSGSDAGEEKPCTAGSDCPKRGVSFEEAEAMMIETVKRNLLSALKMKEPPNGTHPKLSLDSPPISHLIKKYKIKLDRNFEELESEYDDDPEYELDRTSKETVISYARDPLHPNQTGSYFKFNEEDLRYTVDSAVLWFYVKPHPTSNITIDFYRYQRNATHPDAAPIEVKFDRKVIGTQRKGHWKQISIKHLVTKWFAKPETNLGMNIRCREIPDLVVSGPTEEHEHKKPILEIRLSHNERSRRRKRDIDMVCTPQSNYPSCCRYRISISFKNMGWDWIISPPQYTTHYCSGDCPAHYMESNQNRMLALAPSLRPQGLAVCCTPTDMSPMSMLYWDNQRNIIFSSVPNMKVEKCGCM